MDNKSSNLDLITPEITNTKLKSGGEIKFDSNLLKLGSNNMILKDTPIHKLSNSPMRDQDSFNTQDLDMNLNLLRKKRGKKDIDMFNSLTPDLQNQDEKGITLEETTNNKLLNSPIHDQKSKFDNFQNLDMDFSSLKKKRRKKVGNGDLSISHDLKLKTDSFDLHTTTDTDYNYEDLLDRIYKIICEKDPNYKSGAPRNVVINSPQIIKVGAKKTSFVNFLDVCKTLHRSPQHLQSFILAELATSASIDNNNLLIIKGRFEQRQIETVLRHYIKEYVTCHACHSFDTILQKDFRLYFLMCEACGSRWSVASIKSGYQAVTSKRAALRAKIN